MTFWHPEFLHEWLVMRPTISSVWVYSTPINIFLVRHHWKPFFSNAFEVLMFSGVHFYLSNFSLYLHPLMSRSVNIFIFYFPCFHSLLSGYIMGCNYLTIISNIKFCNIRNKVLLYCLYTPVAWFSSWKVSCMYV